MGFPAHSSSNHRARVLPSPELPVSRAKSPRSRLGCCADRWCAADSTPAALPHLDKFPLREVANLQLTLPRPARHPAHNVTWHGAPCVQGDFASPLTHVTHTRCYRYCINSHAHCRTPRPPSAAEMEVLPKHPPRLLLPRPPWPTPGLAERHRPETVLPKGHRRKYAPPRGWTCPRSDERRTLCHPAGLALRLLARPLRGPCERLRRSGHRAFKRSGTPARPAPGLIAGGLCTTPLRGWCLISSRR